MAPTTHYYRRMLSPLLGALRFKCNNTAYRPVLDAIELLARYTDVSVDQKHFTRGETVPIEGVVPKAWLEAVTGGEGRIERIPYELCVLIELRKALRRREIWVATSTTTATCTAGGNRIRQKGAAAGRSPWSEPV